MKKFIKFLKYIITFYDMLSRNIDDDDLSDLVFRIAVKTPYPVNDILEFIDLTGIEIEDAELLLYKFSKNGVSNIKDVSILSRMGYFYNLGK